MTNGHADYRSRISWVIAGVLALALSGCFQPVASTPPTFQVVYNGNGADRGSVPVDSARYEAGQSAPVLAPGSLARSAHLFVTWNTEADGSGTDYEPGNDLAVYGADVELFALWADETMVRFVSTTGSDEPWRGTATRPFAGVQYAIDSLVSAGVATGSVRIAAGVYHVAAAVTMAPGISLYGGYSASNWDDRRYLTASDRGDNAYATEIRNETYYSGITNSVTTSDGLAVHAADAAIGLDTVVEGLTLTAVAPVAITDGASLTVRRSTLQSMDTTVDDHSSVGVLVSGGSATISDNDIRLGAHGGANVRTSAILYRDVWPTLGGPLVVERNAIDLGETTGLNGTLRGLELAGSGSIAISNNVVYGGMSTWSTLMVYFTPSSAGSPQVVNNTFYFPEAPNTRDYGVFVTSTDDLEAKIVNNLFVNDNTAAITYALYETGPASGEIDEILFNSFHGFGSIFQNYDGDDLETYDSIAEFTASDLSAFEGNVTVEPTFVDLSARLFDLTGPPAIAQGGFNNWPGITTDIEGSTRTAPWSIGAYESD